MWVVEYVKEGELPHSPTQKKGIQFCFLSPHTLQTVIHTCEICNNMVQIEKRWLSGMYDMHVTRDICFLKSKALVPRVLLSLFALRKTPTLGTRCM